MSNKLQEKALKLADLAKQFDMSVKLRQIYDLGNDGIVTVEKVKPSGVTIQEIERDISKALVNIKVDGSIVVTTDLKSHEEALRNYGQHT